MSQYVPHGFSPQVAEHYGVNAAIIFQYLCYCSDNHQSRWVAPTLADLCKRYPYMGEWQVWAALKKLTNPGKKTPPLILRKQVNGVYLYRPTTTDGFCNNPHTFDVRIATKVGVIPAVLYHNLGHWIRENWKRRAEALHAELHPEEFDFDEAQMQRLAYQMTRGAATHYTTAVEWVAEHPYVTERTAKRGFSCLQQAGLIRKGIRKRHKQFWHLTRKTLSLFEQEMLSKSDLGTPSAKTQSQRPKPKPDGQNPKSTAKTQNETGLSGSPEVGSESLIEAVVEEPRLRLKKQLADNSDAFRASSPLADARSAKAGTASTSATPSASRWNQPNLPRERKPKRDVFGEPQKLTRCHRPEPNDPEYYEYLDSLTEEQRLALGS